MNAYIIVSFMEHGNFLFNAFSFLFPTVEFECSRLHHSKTKALKCDGKKYDYDLEMV